MARPRIKIVSPGVRRLLSDPGVRDDLEDRGRRVLARAQVEAPSQTGALRASLRMQTVEEDRTVVQVGSDLPYAMRIAAATGFLTRSLDAAG